MNVSRLFRCVTNHADRARIAVEFKQSDLDVSSGSLCFLFKEKLMSRKYESEEEIWVLVRAFESANVPRGQWKHAEHLIVALYYVSHYDIETATEKMRSGILNLLANGFKIDLAKEMPYHETITVFWIRAVAAFHASSNGKPIADKIVEMVERFDKEYLLSFYSRERLFSDGARARYIEPDLVVTR
jgi:hypothetical protein